VNRAPIRYEQIEGDTFSVDYVELIIWNKQTGETGVLQQLDKGRTNGRRQHGIAGGL
jgi:hypothetical protein